MSQNLIIKYSIAFLFGIFVFSMTRGDGLSIGGDTKVQGYFSPKCKDAIKDNENCRKSRTRNDCMLHCSSIGSDNRCSPKEMQNWCDKIEDHHKCKNAITKDCPGQLDSNSTCTNCVSYNSDGLVEESVLNFGGCDSTMLIDACELYFPFEQY
jgi:hypothetical protein